MNLQILKLDLEKEEEPEIKLPASVGSSINKEFSDVQAGFRKGRGTRDQIANICWNIDKARKFQKYIYFYLIDGAEVFDCVDHKKLWNILKEM